MLWVALSLLVIIASAVLATWRYFQLATNLTHLQAPPAIFIVKNRSILTPTLISSLINSLPQSSPGLTFEMLKRDQDQVLVLVIPRWVIAQHPEIQTLEIEDYLPNMENMIQDAICLQFADPKNKIISSNFFQNLFNYLNLTNNEAVFVQLIAHPYDTHAASLDANIRVVVVASDRGRSQQIQQAFLNLLSQNTSLIRNTREQNSAEILENYRSRQYARHESLRCSLTPSEVDFFLL